MTQPGETRLQTVDFRTDTQAHGHRAIGIGVYDQAVPSLPVDVLLNGEAVSFRNPATVHGILAAARSAEALKARRTLTDCFGLVALYGA